VDTWKTQDMRGQHYLRHVCVLDNRVLHSDPTYVTMPNPRGIMDQIMW